MSILNFLQNGTNGGSLTGSLVMIGLMIVIFYFFLIRPQKKQEKETKRMIDALKKGDKIGVVGETFEEELTQEPHLHLEFEQSGKSVNPLDFLSKESVATLLEDTNFEDAS